MATSYYWITDLDTWGSATTDDDHVALCKAAQDWLSDHEGDNLEIYCRPTRKGEAAGVYVEKADGDLQILGHSSPIPDEVNDLTNRAWEAALKGHSEAQFEAGFDSGKAAEDAADEWFAGPDTNEHHLDAMRRLYPGGGDYAVWCIAWRNQIDKLANE